MEKIYVVMRAHWIVHRTYSDDPEEINCKDKTFRSGGDPINCEDKAFRKGEDAINYAIDEANKLITEWREHEHLDEDDTPEAYSDEVDDPYGDIFEIVANKDPHEYIRYWIEEKEVL